MEPKELIIAGCRDVYLDPPEMDAILAFFGLSPVAIVQGGGRGVDESASAWARDRSVLCATVEAEWGLYGRSAGPRRNREMARRPEAYGLLAIWDGRSPGTRSMILEAIAAGLSVWIWPTIIRGEVP